MRSVDCAIALPQLSATKVAAAARRMVFMIVLPSGIRRHAARTAGPDCINTVRGPHVHWLGKCLNQPLEFERAPTRERRSLDGCQLRPTMTRRRMITRAGQFGPLDAAALDRMRAPQMQMATGGRVDRARHVARQ